MGKKKHGYVPEEEKPSLLDRILTNRALTIVVGIGIVAAFAGLAILIVTLLGGDELSRDDVDALAIPSPVGPPPEIGRSAAADVLTNKTWDEMTPAERELVESEVRRVFDNSEFRARNGFVEAVDVFRKDGETMASRTYPLIGTVGNEARATQTSFYCTGDDGTVRAFRYFIAPSARDFREGTTEEFPVAWSPILSGTSWDEVTDLGFREAGGSRLHGLELDFTLPGGDASDRVQYWFDVETARLIERGRIIEDDPESTEANWYRLQYDLLARPQIPSDMEQPPCVQEILATIAP